MNDSDLLTDFLIVNLGTNTACAVWEYVNAITVSLINIID